ncbi:MAG: DUF1499 domain-containing protein [Gammaproteobacteria bacterium]|nr:DUF1499 domain-containing protein [Gammaproteobacteria bacterium]
MSWRFLLTVLLLVLPDVAPVFAAEGNRPMPVRLAACPDSPNCVSSDATDPPHHVPPFTIILPPAEAWRLVREEVKNLPRTEIGEATGNYLHAECRSAVFRFVDDLELELRPDEKIIAVRSASRVGYSDFGVNRRRVENLRTLLRDRGAVK